MKDYHTYIFDLDGTLLDTLGDLTAAVNHALGAHQMPLRTIDEVRAFVGNGVRLLMERAVPASTGAEEFERVFASFRSYYMEHSLDTTRPYRGIPELLRELKRRGKRMAVVSNKMMAATKELVAHFFPEVEVAIGENEKEGIRKKPAPDTVEAALRELGVGKEDAVYVGDSDVDLATARNSGLECISVLWGFRDRQYLTANGARIFVSNPLEIVAT